MTTIEGVSLLIVVVLSAYQVVALLAPEKFA